MTLKNTEYTKETLQKDPGNINEEFIVTEFYSGEGTNNYRLKSKGTFTKGPIYKLLFW